MCRICEPGEIRFMIPITKPEAKRLTTICQGCGGIAIDISRFPSLVKNWKVLPSMSLYGERLRAIDDVLDHYLCPIIV
jgi:hypothetical protein